jgi:glycerate 2-kinase
VRVLCAPDSFKETLSAVGVAKAMAQGAEAAGAEVDFCPIADGGEGTLDALIVAMAGKLKSVRVLGPLGEPMSAGLGICSADDETLIGIVELARAAGLELVAPDARDPTRTTTYGVGSLIAEAIERGCREIIVGVGGSATCDGGTGIAQAMGARLYNLDGLITSPMTGGMLTDLVAVEWPSRAYDGRIRVACDVTNPLCGPSGAAAVYGPQKGATPEQVELLDAGLRHFASLVGGDPMAPGVGAAGGAAFGLSTLCGATLERGVDLVLEAVRFPDRCRQADLVLTGEGRLDAQTLNGKAVAGVAAAAQRLGVSTVAIVGATGPGASDCLDPSKGGHLRSVVSLIERFGVQASMQSPARLITGLAREIVMDELAKSGP